MEIEKIQKFGSWLGSLLAGLSVIIRYGMPWIQARRERRTFLDGMRTLQVIYSAMERAEGSGATRAIIFGGHNAEGNSRPSPPYYVTALLAHVPGTMEAKISDYRELCVDAHYLNLLLEIERDGCKRFDMAGPDSILKSIYAAEGVVDSLIFFLCIRDNTFFFMSFASYERQFTLHEVTALTLNARTIGHAIRHSK